MNFATAVHRRHQAVSTPTILQHARVRWVLPAALIILYVIQCAWFIRTQSFTFDEPIHIFTGWDMWRHGRFQYWNDHPPLSRLLCILPILSPKWQMGVPGPFPGFRAVPFYTD